MNTTDYAERPETKPTNLRSWFNARHEIWRWLVPSFVGLLVGTTAFLFGPGILIKPKISISCGAVDSRIPSKFKMELMSTKIGLLAPEMAVAVTNSMTAHLREYGFSDSRIQYALSDNNMKSQSDLTSRETGLLMQA